MPDQTPHRHPNDRDERKRVGAWIVGMNFAYGVVGSLLLGLLIDWLAGTTPIWTLVMLGAGLIGGAYVFVREAISMNTGSTRGVGRAGSSNMQTNSNHVSGSATPRGDQASATEQQDQH